MARFLDTTGVNFYLQKLIKGASTQLVLVSPYLQVNDRIRELLEDKSRLKVDIRIVYGKVELQPSEITWLRGLDHVRTSFCKNLHAKCYLSENGCIVTSMNLYQFSQVNNNEMGVCIDARTDPDLFRDAKAEVQRILRISETVRMSAETIDEPKELAAPPDIAKQVEYEKLTTSKLAKKLGIKTNALNEKLIAAGYLEMRDGRPYITDAGKQAGGEFRSSSRYGPYFIWPQDLSFNT